MLLRRQITRLRRSAIINLTLTDMMIALLFVLLLFTFRAKEEGLKEVSAAVAQLQQVLRERDELKSALAVAQETIATLERRLKEREELIARLLDQDRDRLSPDRRTLVERFAEESKRLAGEIKRLRAENAQLAAEKKSLEDLVGSQQRHLGQMRNQLQGRGTGLPRCPVTAGYLIDITLLAKSAYSVKPAWEPGAEARARILPAVSEMTAAQELSPMEFQRLAEQVARWGETQEVPCRFHVLTRAEGMDLDTYRTLMRRVDRFFYPKRY